MKNKKIMTFTKRIVAIILVIALIDMQFPFILAFMDKPQIAEELGKVIVVEIIGVVLVYCLKSFFETREEENTKTKRMRIRSGDITGFDDAEVIEVEDEN